MWAKVPEFAPREVGTPIPISPQVPSETYTYDYIIVGGTSLAAVEALADNSIQVAQPDVR